MGAPFPYTEALIGACFVHPPFEHQLRDFEGHAESPARAKAWTMRTGKSKAEIDRACHNFLRGRIDGVLIFAPNGVHANWVEREFPAHAWPGVNWSGLVWRSTESGSKGFAKLRKADQAEWHERREAWWKRLAAVRQDRGLMVLAVNSESMTRADVRKAVARFIKHRRVFVIFDESDDFGTPGTKRTKMARALARRCAMRSILSGTMLTGSPLAAFSQFELLEKAALGFETFEDFKNHFAEYELERGRGGRRYPKLTGFKNLEELRERMAPFVSVVRREDCKDMPELVCSVRKITPSAQQLAAYRELHHDFMIDVANGRVSVGERAPRFQKMQQVFSGFVIDESRKVVWLPGPNPRLAALREEMYLAPGKVIIWCQFQADIDAVTKQSLADGYKVVAYHGRVSDKAKQIALNLFREDRSVKALVGHIQSGGRGVDMSAASKIIVYSHTFKARLREQAKERATKIGGGNVQLVDFQSPGPDARILQVTESRVNVADFLTGAGMQEFLKGIAL